MNALRWSGSRFGRPELISLITALAWAVGLLIAALVVPVYQSSTVVAGSSAPGSVGSGTATLVGVNGWSALFVASLPLVAAVVTVAALWQRSGRHGAGAIAWAVTGLLACFNVLAILSIGVFVVPVTAALVIACGTHGAKPRRPDAAAT